MRRQIWILTFHVKKSKLRENENTFPRFREMPQPHHSQQKNDHFRHRTKPVSTISSSFFLHLFFFFSPHKRPFSKYLIGAHSDVSKKEISLRWWKNSLSSFFAAQNLVRMIKKVKSDADVHRGSKSREVMGVDSRLGGHEF